MKQKTAIRLLINHLTLLHTEYGHKISIETVINLAKQLEPVNEQQIIDAFEANKNWSYAKDKGHIYFNDTFEKL